MIYEVASMVVQQMIPPKLYDPSSFIIKIAMGNGKEVSCMLDLGAGMDLMLYYIFKQLDLRYLKPTRTCLQLAGRTIRYPKGVVEDII